MNTLKKIKVGIIGGGVAGVSSAMKLLEDTRFDVYLFEVKSSLGGRISSFKDPIANEIIDNGKHLMVGAYQHFFDLLSRLGTYSDLTFQEHLEVNFRTEKESYKFTSGKLGKINQLFSLLKIKQFTLSEKMNLIRFVTKLNKIHTNIDENATPLELLVSQKQSQNLIKLFWEPIILATMNISPQEGSAKIFTEVLTRSTFSSKLNQRLVFSEVPLADLLLPIERKLSENLQLIKSTLINQINCQENKWDITSQSGQKWQFDALVLALPINQTFKLLQNSIEMNPTLLNSMKNSFEKLERFSESIEFSPILSIYLWSSENFMVEDFAGLIDSEFHWIFKEKSSKNRFTLTKSNAENLVLKSRKEILDIAFRDLEKIFPKFKSENIFHNQIIYEKQATIKITPTIEKTRPGQDFGNNLFLSGDWTNTNLPATIESAAKSGQIAAEILKQKFI